MRDRPGSAPPQQGGAGVGDSAPAATYTLPEFPYIQFPLPDLVPPPASLLKVDAKMAAASHGMIVNTFHDLEGRYIYRALETTQWAQQRLARRATVLVPSTIILGRSRCQAPSGCGGSTRRRPPQVERYCTLRLGHWYPSQKRNSKRLLQASNRLVWIFYGQCGRTVSTLAMGTRNVSWWSENGWTNGKSSGTHAPRDS
jgi:hypothetical protein